MKKIFLIALAIALANGMAAQVAQFISLDASVHGTTVPAPGVDMALYDDGGAAGEYTPGHDYWITLRSTCDSNDTTGFSHMGITFIAFDVGCHDTLYLYDGPTINSPLLLKRNNCYTNDSNEHFFVGASNITQEMTV